MYNICPPNQVLVAAGGKPGFQGSFSSTEFLHLGASHWTYGPELPRPLDGASAALVNGKVILTGGFGNEGNEVSIVRCSKPHLEKTISYPIHQLVAAW